MGDTTPAAQTWLDGLNTDRREQVESLAALVTGAAPEATADAKWGRLTFTGR